MAATGAQLIRLRRMVGEPESDTYDDAALAEYLEAYPLTDGDGYEPDDSAWTETYDLHRAAADVWQEKAAAVAQDFSFSADGASYRRNEVYEQYMKQARHHLSRSRVDNVAVKVDPSTGPAEDVWRGNYNDPYA